MKNIRRMYSSKALLEKTKEMGEKASIALSLNMLSRPPKV